MKTYLVTGATGTVGSAVVPLLLEDPEARVVLLLRAGDAGQLEARLEILYAFWGLPPGDARRQRVHALRGDVEAPRLGLDPDQWQALATTCTHILHCAGKVRMNLPIEAARQAAVASARNVVELARAALDRGPFAKVEFVSTVGVGGRMPGPVPERWITEARTFHNTYEQSKAEAEDLIRAEVEAGLPLTVHRPSMVVGDSRTGQVVHFQIFYHLCEFLSGRRSFGLFPDLGEARLDIVPVDAVARVLVWSAHEPGTVGRILHLCSGPRRSLRLMELRRTVRAVFRAHGVPVPPSLVLPLSWIKATVPLIVALSPEKTRRALSTLPIFFDYLGEEQAFANELTTLLLAQAGINLPDPRDYVERVLAWYAEHHPAR